MVCKRPISSCALIGESESALSRGVVCTAEKFNVDARSLCTTIRMRRDRDRACVEARNGGNLGVVHHIDRAAIGCVDLAIGCQNACDVKG